MKRIIEEAGEGFEKLMGEVVTLYCMNYFYTGTLTGDNETYVLLTNPSIVYETGPYNEKRWKVAEALPHDIYVMKAAIEAFGIIK